MAESLPPLTLDHLLTDLDNPTLTAYVYIGAEKDDGWAIALAAERMISQVRVYRVGPDDASAVRKQFAVSPATVGVVFGFARDVKNAFTKAKAEDALIVFNAIWDSDD
jgi:hypothetical protein